MKENPKSVGEKSEGIIIAALLKRGEVILIPFGNNQRYDLVIDQMGIFKRIQCKTARLFNNDVLIFEGCSKAGGKNKNKKGYKGEADLFAVYSPQLDKCYLIPVNDVPSSAVSLRINPPKNGMKKGIRYASDFEI